MVCDINPTGVCAGDAVRIIGRLLSCRFVTFRLGATTLTVGDSDKTALWVSVGDKDPH